MWLAGEELGDVHDTDQNDVNATQQDPVQWNRAALLENAALKANVAKLIQPRTSHPALQRNKVEFFYFHSQLTTMTPLASLRTAEAEVNL
jgi:hypothetical protein